MSNIQRTAFFVATVITLSLVVFPVFAQVAPIVRPNCGFPWMNCTGLETFGGQQNSIMSFVRIIINIVLSFVGIIAAIFIIYAGIKYITSRGDEEAAKTAKNQIVYALLGVIIAATAYLIVNTITNLDAGPLKLVIRDIVNTLLVFVSIITAIYIIIAGAFYITSQGDEEQAKRAKKQILYAILGLLVILVSGILVNFIIGAV